MPLFRTPAGHEVYAGGGTAPTAALQEAVDVVAAQSGVEGLSTTDGGVLPRGEPVRSLQRSVFPSHGPEVWPGGMTAKKGGPVLRPDAVKVVHPHVATTTPCMP